MLEVADRTARRTGIIPKPSVYESVLTELAAALERTGLRVLGAAASQIAGSKGTVEFWLRIAKSAQPQPVRPDIAGHIKRAVLTAGKLHGAAASR